MRIMINETLVDPSRCPSARDLVDQIVEALEPAAPAPTARPDWLPAWATQEFFAAPGNAAFSAPVAPAIANAQGGVDMNAWSSALALALRPDPAARAPRAPKPADIPEFSGSQSDYPDWRAAVLSAVSASGASSVSDHHAAIGATQSRLRSAASAFARDLVPASFASVEQFLQELDSAFLSATLLEDARRELARFRPSPSADWATFVVHFETLARRARLFAPASADQLAPTSRLVM
jgi:hypothetical protein